MNNKRINNKEKTDKKEQQLKGVGVVIEDIKGEILFVTETNQKGKSWKKEGQISLPFGTKKDKEGFKKSVQREIKEETGLEISTDIIEKNGEIVLKIIEENQETYIPIQIFTITISTEEMEKAKNFKNCEVSGVQTKNLEEIKQKATENIEGIRPGTLETLFAAKNKHGWNIYIPIKEGHYPQNYKNIIEKVLLKN